MTDLLILCITLNIAKSSPDSDTGEGTDGGEGGGTGLTASKGDTGSAISTPVASDKSRKKMSPEEAVKSQPPPQGGSTANTTKKKSFFSMGNKNKPVGEKYYEMWKTISCCVMRYVLC